MPPMSSHHEIPVLMNPSCSRFFSRSPGRRGRRRLGATHDPDANLRAGDAWWSRPSREKKKKMGWDNASCMPFNDFG